MMQVIFKSNNLIFIIAKIMCGKETSEKIFFNLIDLSNALLEGIFLVKF